MQFWILSCTKMSSICCIRDSSKIPNAAFFQSCYSAPFLAPIEKKELVEYLKDVVIYKKDNSYTEYAGQGVTFTLTMSDGTQTQIMAYNPFLVIDGVGCRTKYEPCEALNNYANRLLDDENANIILEEPPASAIIQDIEPTVLE